MSDLDRAYVINGDDLRIALSGGDGKPPLVPNPRDVAEYIIGKFAAPLGDDVVDAHVCCEHVPGSLAASELQQADRIVRMFQGYGPGSRHVRRVLRWAWDYLTDGDEPPF